MKDSQTKNDVLESQQYMTLDEIAELDALLAGVPEPVTITMQIVRPDGSTEGYLLHTPEGYAELSPDDPLLEGCPPVTPEVNGGYRVGERP
jgi:hypothetical protein